MKEVNKEENLENEKPKRRRLAKVSEDITPPIDAVEEAPKKIVLKEKKKAKEPETSEPIDASEEQTPVVIEETPEVIKIDFKKEKVEKKPFNKTGSKGGKKKENVDLFDAPENEEEVMPSNEATELAAPMEEKVLE
jgi:hypothetical protein